MHLRPGMQQKGLLSKLNVETLDIAKKGLFTVEINPVEKK